MLPSPSLVPATPEGDCYVDKVLADDEVRLLWLVGTRDGTDIPDSSGEVAQWLDREAKYATDCGLQ